MAKQRNALPTVARVLALVKNVFLTAPRTLEAYTTEFFGGDLKGERATQRNKTKRLRVFRGGLQRAVQPGEPGNITELNIRNGVLEFESGVDTSIVPYAIIHELGGTIRHPGGTPYMIGRGGRAVFLRKGDPRAIGKTRPHPIKIPARPYLKPGMQRFNDEALPRYIKRLMKLLEEE